MNNCEYCGRLFKQNVHNQRYCSSICRRRGRARRENPDNYTKVVRERRCLVCDEVIPITDRKDKIYCSRSCLRSDLTLTKVTETKGVRLLGESLKRLILKDTNSVCIIKHKDNDIHIDSKYERCITGLKLHISKGYARTNYKGAVVTIHRLIYYLEHGVLSDKDNPIDHINRNKLDNTINNLRLVTVSTNNRNKDYSNKTNHKGIYQSGNRFIAQIWKDGKNHHIGSYDTIEEAISARAEVERKVLAS